jgi:hypothetical protein
VPAEVALDIAGLAETFADQRLHDPARTVDEVRASFR